MLRLKRNKLMLSQIDASKVLGINNTYLSLIENGKRIDIDKKLFFRICLLYRISDEELKNFFIKTNTFTYYSDNSSFRAII